MYGQRPRVDAREFTCKMQSLTMNVTCTQATQFSILTAFQNNVINCVCEAKIVIPVKYDVKKRKDTTIIEIVKETG